jgi:hypothetical protein
MSTVGGGVNIVVDGLVLYLDAANTKSYISGSTTWSDVSRSGNRGTLVVSGSGAVSASFNSANQGNIVFSGTGSYVDCGNSTNLQLTSGSINVWFRGIQGTQTGTGGYNAIVVKQFAYGLFISGSNLVTYDWGNNVGRNTNTNVANNTWYNACMTFTTTTGTPSNNAIIYLNGSPILTTTIRLSNQTVNLFIGYGNSVGQFLVGSVSQTSIYNRALSAQEVLQNYNATKTRFGL